METFAPAFCSPMPPWPRPPRPRTCPRVPSRVICKVQIPEGATLLPPILTIEDQLNSLRFNYEREEPAQHLQGTEQIRYCCKYGHIVTSRVGSPACIRCPHCLCAGTRRVCIPVLRALAASRGGELVSTVYSNARQPLLWRCEKGHTWAASLDNVRGKHTWCPVCFHEKRKKTIQDMQRLAASRGAVCLSDEYKGRLAKLRWRCRCGFEFEQSPNNAFRSEGGKRASSWCPQCKKAGIKFWNA